MPSSPTPRSRRRPASRLRALCVTTGVALGALVVGLSGAAGTYALLSDRAETPRATVSAGTFDILVNGQRTSPLGTWNLTPATPAVRSFTVTATGDVPSTLSARITATTSQGITASTQARVTPVASAAACTVGLGGTLADLNGYSAPLGDLARGQTRTFCLETRLKDGTPVTQSGQGLSFTLTMTATQRAR
jgi:predicted ribosomally synthesized peptide with SipW-like signal peptide